MILHLISDMHWEMDTNHAVYQWISQLNPSPDTVLVIAGDLTASSLIASDLRCLRKKYSNIVYVAGNHEYWGDNVHSIRNRLSQIDIEGVHILMNEAKVIGGKTFYGGTGWFPYIPGTESCERFMNDFAQIHGFKPWVYEQNQQFIENARKQKNDIIVSHHLPTRRCVTPQFSQNPLNPFFLIEGDELLVEPPKAWLFGHTHEAQQLQQNNCTMYCNPRGYPGKASPNYKPKEIML